MINVTTFMSRFLRGFPWCLEKFAKPQCFSECEGHHRVVFPRCCGGISGESSSCPRRSPGKPLGKVNAQHGVLPTWRGPSRAYCETSGVAFRRRSLFFTIPFRSFHAVAARTKTDLLNSNDDSKATLGLGFCGTVLILHRLPQSRRQGREGAVGMAGWARTWG